MNDYALIRLDRKVVGRTPLKYRKSGKIAEGQEIVVIGHPTGLPTKVAGGANVRENHRDVFFNANLDTFGGNSGSAVFNADTGEVEGILVRGEQDYEYDWSKGCRVVYKCTDDGCRGEDVTRITNIEALMNM
jgi:V8-like Glu-specific endopeptidase